VLLIALLLIFAAPASAATVEQGGSCDHFCSFELTYTAAPGEVNDLTITRPAPGVLEFHDPGAPVSGCAAIDAHTVRCPSGTGSDSTFVSADLGDGDDTFHGSGSVDGGPGSDLLVSTEAASFVDDDGAEPDRYVGRAVVDYSSRLDDLRIDLRAGQVMPDGDVLEGVPSATGGSGDDVLIGTDGRNELIGGYGSDRLVGLGGNDDLITGIYSGDAHYEPRGRNIVDGGAGDDRIIVTSRHDAGNVLRCGSGRDYVLSVMRRDFVGGDCNRLALNAYVNHFSVHIHPRKHVFVTEHEEARKIAYAGRHVVARGRRNLRLNALGRRLLERHGRLKVTVEMHDLRKISGFRMELRR
jgi:hypothetical protein